ncbi:MAG: YigZ family protein [Bacteroidales bacterium]|nr:YigZ family protein [Bacteroidales bacterium]MDD4216679.1 YigZ family protein [Bacteroidales bacterium]MDY0141619.1 YigZ family protein [Bacteroidales bacterium]
MMDTDVFLTIENQTEGFYSDKGSKFYSFAYPVSSEDEIKTIQQSLRKKYHSSRHQVYAFMLGPDKEHYRANDDGEPANSSGMPVLGQIKSFNLTDILIVVVRYFGGTKLGIPGLINAYKNAAKDALDKAKIIEKFITKEAELIFDYDEIAFVMKTLSDADAKINNQTFLENCKLVFSIRLSEFDNLIGNLSKNHKIEILLKDG